MNDCIQGLRFTIYASLTGNGGDSTCSMLFEHTIPEAVDRTYRHCHKGDAFGTYCLFHERHTCVYRILLRKKDYPRCGLQSQMSSAEAHICEAVRLGRPQASLPVARAYWGREPISY